MTSEEKQYYRMSAAVGYWSELGGLELKDIQSGIEDYAIVVSGAWSKEKTVHRVKIVYGDRPYIRLFGTRHYIDECIKCDYPEIFEA